MGFNVLRAGMDLVENPPAVDPCTTLMGLFLAHQLTPVLKATRCLQVHGGRQQPEAIRGAGLPSGVLSTGRGEHSLFRAAFTMRLPVAIQAHEAGTDLTVLYGTTFAETTNLFSSRFRFCTYLSFRYNYDSYWI